MKMANNTGKRYSPEFKKQVVTRVVEEGCSVISTAKDFGLSEQTLRNWIRETKDRQIPDKVRLAEMEAELQKSKRRIADLEQTNEILKKAAAIFATSNRK